MSAEDHLDADEIEAARTMLAAMLADDLADAGPHLVAMMQGLVERDETLPLVGAHVIINALLQLIEEELDLDPSTVLTKLAAFLAT